MTARTQDDLAALAEKGKRYKEADGGYTKAQVDVKVTDTTVTGREATLQLTEHTRLYLPFTPQEVEEGAPEYEELSLPHTVTFTQGSDGAWLRDGLGAYEAPTRALDALTGVNGHSSSCPGGNHAATRGSTSEPEMILWRCWRRRTFAETLRDIPSMGGVVLDRCVACPASLTVIPR
ncbi:MAG: hypothetical protein HOY79_00540 [Streptomyces sp.]|nr:hypothetical protein [Streptomyces sp.]